MAETPAREAGRGGSAPAGGGLTGRTLSGLKWAGLSAAAQGVASLAILAVLSRLLTPADFGVMAMALVFVTAAQVLGHRSLGSAIVQRHELGARHVAAALTLSSAAGAALAGALWLLAPAIGRLLAEPAVAPALGALTIAIAISGPATVPEFLLRRRLRFRALAAAELSSQVLGYGLVAIALAAHGFGVWALVWGAVARQGVFAAAVLAAAPRLPRPGLARRETGDVLRAGAGFSSIAFFAWSPTRAAGSSSGGCSGPRRSATTRGPPRSPCSRAIPGRSSPGCCSRPWRNASTAPTASGRSTCTGRSAWRCSRCRRA